MKILMVSSFLPYPLFSGGQVRLFNLIKELSKKHEITLICEKRNNQGEKNIKEVEKICKKVITVPRFKQWSYSNILKTGFSKNAFLITGHTNSLLKEKIKEELKNNYDLIHVETSYVFQNIPKRNTLPTVLVEHNIEYQVYKRYANNSNPILKPLLLIDVLKLQKEEEDFWQKATKVVAVSETEKNLMNIKGVEVVPNGVDLEKFKFVRKDFLKQEKKVLFIGDFKWMQNRVALKEILLKIWPEVNRKRGKEIVLWVIGRNIPQDLKDLNTFENVIFDESNNQETWQIYSKADVLLAPIRVGGGTSFKILESMASGVAVLTTPLGVVGLFAKDEREALIAKDSNEFSEKLTLLLDDKDLYEKITANARKLIEEKFDWKKIAQKLDNIYQSVIVKT